VKTHMTFALAMPHACRLEWSFHTCTST